MNSTPPALCAALLAVLLLASCGSPVRVQTVRTVPKPNLARNENLWPGLQAPAGSQARRRAERGLLECLLREEEGRLPAPGTAWRLRDGLVVEVRGEDLPWKASAGDRYTLAATLRTEGLRESARQDGVGQALVARLSGTPATPADRFYPREGRFYPATALVQVVQPPGPGGENGRVSLRLLHPGTTPEVKLAGVQARLAADYSAPYAMLMQRTDLERERILNMMRPAKLEPRRGVLFLEPVAKDKIPLLLVQGLISSPLTWKEMANAIWADPVLRQRYQVWHYVYPSALPYLYSAKNFRDDVDAALKAATASTGKAPPKMVVVGHSMGGLLTKALVGRADTRMWDAAFDRPIEQLELTPADREALRAGLLPRRDPRIGRVVFIAVPHRGSELARGVVGRLGKELVKLPPDYLAFYDRVVGRNYEALQPEARAVFPRRGISSIEELSDRNPVLQAFATLPIVDIPYHQILGQISRHLQTDAVVPVKSGRIDGARSELVVTGFGHMLHKRPEVIAEVRRILHEHLAQGAR